MANDRTNVKVSEGEAFSSRLADLMAARQLNQSATARGCGFTQGAICNYLNGRLPKAIELCRIADFFQVTTDFLLGRNQPQNPSTK